MTKSTRRPRARRSSSTATLATAVRRKAYWGVFNQTLKRVALFPYHQRRQAQQYAEQLSEDRGGVYFVRPVREEVGE